MRVAKILEDIQFDVATDDATEVFEDTDLLDTEFPFGPFTCVECGEVYADYDDIPESEDD